MMSERRGSAWNSLAGCHRPWKAKRLPIVRHDAWYVVPPRLCMAAKDPDQTITASQCFQCIASPVGWRLSGGGGRRLVPSAGWVGRVARGLKGVERDRFEKPVGQRVTSGARQRRTDGV